jgi:NAD(P)-dependent dehydrogenase (short-subunit alcohol dehydrogenase family)
MTERNDAQRHTVVASRHDGRFNGKVAFVSGASSGIGRATALTFAREGAHVVVADVAAEDNRETARLIEQTGGQALAVTCDVTRGDDIKTALDATVAEFGRLDIAFNNAGIEQPIKPAHEIGDDEWDQLVAVNLRAAVIAHEPIGRMGRPDEIAAAVLWLCSDGAAFAIGHAMVVDGGQTA